MGKPTLKKEDAPVVVAKMVFWRVHLHLFSRCLACVQELFLLSLKKTPLWKVSYEECSLFETSTTQTPILSRIESLAVHINTFQAQIKKCKQNKKIYIYIIFPLSKGFKSQCSKSFWTQNLRSTLFKQLGQIGPCKGYCLFNTWAGIMDGMEQGGGSEGEGERMSRRGGMGMCWGRWGSWDTHMVSWWISFIGFWHFLSGSFFSFPPIPRSNMVEKPHSGGRGLIRPAQSLQSTPGWPIVACGGASQSSHRQAGPAD